MYYYELFKDIFCNMNMLIFQGRCMKEKFKNLNDKITNQFFKQYNFSESIGNEILISNDQRFEKICNAQ